MNRGTHLAQRNDFLRQRYVAKSRGGSVERLKQEVSYLALGFRDSHLVRLSPRHWPSFSGKYRPAHLSEAVIELEV